MELDTLYHKLRFAQRQMIRAAGTSAHGTWKKIVRETEAKIRALAVCDTVSA